LNCNSYIIPHDKKITIGMVGAPSSGKDTLCDYLSAILVNSNKKMTEAARDYMEKNGTLYSPFQQRIIFDKILEREQEVITTYQIALCPGARILTYFYTALLTPHEANNAELDNLIDIYGLSVRAIKDYDYLFFCETLTYHKDGLRYQKDEEITMLQNAILTFLELHKVKYTYLKADSLEQRSVKVLEVIGAQGVDKNEKN